MISRGFITKLGQLSINPSQSYFWLGAVAAPKCRARDEASRVSTEGRLILGRSLRLSRSGAAGELLQAIALVPRRSPNRSIVLRQLYRAIGHLERFGIFLLLVEGESEPQHYDFIRLGRIGVDRLLEVLLRRGGIFFFEIDGADNRIGLRFNHRFIGVDFVLRSTGRHLNVGFYGLGGFLRHVGCFAEALLFVDI